MKLYEIDFYGVYRIVNDINCKIYIGSSIHVNKRLEEHRSTLKNNCHHNIHLQRAWNKYGEENFSFEILEIIEDDVDMLRQKEQYWMDYYKSYNNNLGYNISHYATGSGGYEVSDETKEKIRQAAIGRKASEATKQKLSEQRTGELNSFYGKHHTDEAKRKMSEAKIGAIPTEAQLEALKLGRNGHSWKEEDYINRIEKLKNGIDKSAKLTENDVINILIMIKENKKYSAIKEMYDISETEISRIKHKKRWAYLYEEHPELYS